MFTGEVKNGGDEWLGDWLNTFIDSAVEDRRESWEKPSFAYWSPPV